jgi:hypothetical protein
VWGEIVKSLGEAVSKKRIKKNVLKNVLQTRGKVRKKQCANGGAQARHSAV